MKPLESFVRLGIALACVAQPVCAATYLVDFGPTDGTNGNVTASPDSNGNHWNSWPASLSGGSGITTGPLSNLVSTANQNSSIDIAVSGGSFSSNGIVNGGLLAPSAALLGDFAIATATQDYFFTTSNGELTLSGLNPGFTYDFRFFGTREAAGTRETRYSLTGAGATSTTTLITSGSNIGDDGAYDGNDDEIASISGIAPTAGGEIVLDVDVVSGGFAYLGILELTAVPEPSRVSLFGIAVAGILMRRRR
jgi:hypothetical protein